MDENGTTPVSPAWREQALAAYAPVQAAEEAVRQRDLQEKVYALQAKRLNNVALLRNALSTVDVIVPDDHEDLEFTLDGYVFSLDGAWAHNPETGMTRILVTRLLPEEMRALYTSPCHHFRVASIAVSMDQASKDMVAFGCAIAAVDAGWSEKVASYRERLDYLKSQAVDPYRYILDTLAEADAPDNAWDYFHQLVAKSEQLGSLEGKRDAVARLAEALKDFIAVEA